MNLDCKNILNNRDKIRFRMSILSNEKLIIYSCFLECLKFFINFENGVDCSYNEIILYLSFKIH